LTNRDDDDFTGPSRVDTALVILIVLAARRYILYILAETVDL
jgi:hypothetical protein